jgi:predicted transcriptional regulator
LELTIIEQRILKILFKNNGKMTIRELHLKSRTSTTSINLTLINLERIGLVTENKEKNFPRRRFIILTEKGKKVAELLVKIDDVLSS